MQSSLPRAICLLFLSLPLQACMTYSAKPITATVVDAQTKQPIEDVVVVAHWELNGGLEGGNIEGNMMVMETVTDTAGRFHFPGWGPKLKPKGTSFSAQLKSNDPEIYLFKSGYRPGTFHNALDMDKERRDPRVRTSDWDDKELPLQKFEGSLKEYAETEIFRFSYELGRTLGPRCTWTTIPRMILALGEQTKTFEAAGIHTETFYTSLRDNEEYRAKEGCSFRKFVQEHSNEN